VSAPDSIGGVVEVDLEVDLTIARRAVAINEATTVRDRQRIRRVSDRRGEEQRKS
jgi:hypothetical protein